MAGVYLVGAWLVVQVAATLLPVFSAPDWVMKLVVGLLTVAFLPAMAIAWWYELTPRGLELDSADQGWKRRRSDRPPAPPNSVAVLPLKTGAGGEDVERFADGLHDDLLTQLARIRSLKVISRTSMQEYCDTRKNLREIAAELGVANVVEGGVQQQRSHVRLNVQLIDARSDTHLWAESFDREIDDDDLFEMQSEIALSIANALHAQLLPEDAEALNRRMTSDAGAWRAYRAALRLVDRADVGDFDRAALLIDEALARDPNFAAAWALRARNAIARYWFGKPDDVQRRASRIALDKAQAMDANAPEVLVAEGYYHYWGFRDYARALAATSKALDLRPNDPDVLRLQAFVLRRTGDFAAASDALKRALEFDPRSAFGHIELALTLIRLRRFAEAEEHADRGLALDPMWAFGRMARALVLIERDGDLAAALEFMVVPDAGNSQPAFRRWWLLNALGRFDEALAQADFGRYASDRSYCWPASLMRGLTLTYAGRDATAQLRAALVEIEALREQEPDYEPALGALCLAHGALGDAAAARAAAAPFERFAERDAVQLDEARYLVACALALAGEVGPVLTRLDAQLVGPHYNGLAHIEHEPAFAQLRNSSAYARWLLVQQGPLARARSGLRPIDRWLLVGTFAGVAILGARTWWPEAPRAAPTTAAFKGEAASLPSPKHTQAQPELPVAASAKSIAVLPFVNLSDANDVAYFGDGLSEEIMNSLMRIDGIDVAGRASAFQFKNQNLRLSEIGARLNVRYVLQGSVRRENKRARITAKLVRASDGLHVWSQAYDRQLDDVLDVQLDIADRVVAALDVLLDEGARERMRSIGIRNVDAFIAFQKGRALYAAAHDPARSDNLIATLREANQEFARVIELDPGFAPAYYLSTDLHNHLVMADDISPEERKKAVAMAIRDLRLASRNSFDADEKLLIEVDRQLASDDWRGLGERMAQAVERQRHRQSNWLPLAATFGFGPQRLVHTEQVIIRDPLSSLSYFNAASSANWANNPRRALEIVELASKAIGGSPTITLQGLRAALRLGDLQRAHALLAKLDAQSANGIMGKLLMTHAQGGDVVALAREAREKRKPGWNPEVWVAVDFLAGVLSGDLTDNNRRAAQIDLQPGGALRLTSLANVCQCGAPFDIAATPNFAQRLIEAQLPWPPLDLLQPINAKPR